MLGLEDLQQPPTSGLYREGEHDRPGGIALSGQLADLVAGQIPYLLEIWESGKVVCAVGLPYVQAIEVMRPAATDLAWTLTSVSRQFSVNRALDVEIQGHSGLRHRAGHSRRGEFIYRDGPGIMRELDAFFDLYQAIARRAGERLAGNPDDYEALWNQNQDTYMVLRSFRERLHVRVEPLAWSFAADKGRHRLSYGWSLRLKAYAAAAPAHPANILGPVADAALVLAAGLDQANAYLALIDSLGQGLRSDLQVLGAPLEALRRTGGLLGQVRGTVNNLLDFPGELLAQFTGALDAFVQGLEVLVGLDEASGLLTGSDTPPRAGTVQDTQTSSAALRAYSEGLATQAGLYAALGALGVSTLVQAQAREQVLGLPRQSLEQLGGRPGQEERSRQAGRQAGVFFSSGRGTRGGAGLAQLRQGEDFATLAGLVLGNPSRWREVASLNGALGIDTLADGRRLEAGMIVFVPGLPGAAAATLDPEDIWGQDLLVDPDNGDLVVDDDGVDVLTVRGSGLLEQGLRHRFLTLQAESVWSGYGLPEFVGSGSSDGQLIHWAALLAEQALADPRITSVQSMAVTDVGDGARIEIKLAPQVGEVRTIVAPGPGATSRRQS